MNDRNQPSTDGFDAVVRALHEAETRVEELHSIIERKNAIIRMLSLGDLTEQEAGFSDCPTP